MGECVHKFSKVQDLLFQQNPPLFQSQGYSPQKLPSFMDYDCLPLLPPPPTYKLPSSVCLLHVTMNGRLWEITSPNSLLVAFCPGVRPTNLNFHVNHYKEEHQHQENVQLHFGNLDFDVRNFE